MIACVVSRVTLGQQGYEWLLDDCYREYNPHMLAQTCLTLPFVPIFAARDRLTDLRRQHTSGPYAP